MSNNCLPDIETALLIKEASLSSSMLSIGLNSLKQANFLDKGLYYLSFFNLSIGIERLLKLIYIQNYRNENHYKFPSNEQLKKYSHNIYELYNDVLKYKPENLKYNLNDEMYDKIIKMLSRFAKTSRYYNLDVLTNKKKESDPLVEWGNIQSSIQERYELFNTERSYLSIAKQLAPFSVIRSIGEDNKWITSHYDYFCKIDITMQIHKYAVLYLYKIIRYLVVLLAEIEKLPDLSNIFLIFKVFESDEEIIKHENWFLIEGEMT